MLLARYEFRMKFSFFHTNVGSLCVARQDRDAMLHAESKPLLRPSMLTIANAKRQS